MVLITPSIKTASEEFISYQDFQEAHNVSTIDVFLSMKYRHELENIQNNLANYNVTMVCRTDHGNDL